MAPVLVNVVIPTFNRKEHLYQTLRSLQGQTYPDFEVIVVDDGSEEDLSGEIAALYLPYTLSYYRIPHRGRAGARNEGIRRSNGDIILFFDDHSQPHSRLVEEHVRKHLARPAYGVFRGRIEYATEYRDSVPYLRGRLLPHLRHLIHAGDPIVDFGTHNLSVKREAIDRAGLFDEQFTLYGGEDQEFGIRIKKAGYRVGYLPKALTYNIRIPKGEVNVLMRAIESGKMAALLVNKHPEYRVKLGLHAINRAFYLRRSLCASSAHLYQALAAGSPVDSEANVTKQVRLSLYLYSLLKNLRRE